MNFLKKPATIIALISIVLIISGSIFYFSQNRGKTYELATVAKNNVIQEVSVTGKVKPAKSVDLAFEGNGRVSAINIAVGDNVRDGQILATLDSSSLQAQLAQANANVKTQQAKLDQLKIGTRTEELQVQQTKIDNAAISVLDAKKNLIAVLKDAYTKSDDAIRNKTDQFFNNPRSQNPQLNIPISDQQLEYNTESQRILIENILTSWEITTDQLSVSASDLSTYVDISNANLNAMSAFLSKMALIVNTLTPSSNLSQTTIDGYKANVSTARTNINTSISGLSASAQSLNTAASALSLYQQELSLKKAGSTIEEIAAQQAQVEQAKANAQNIQAQIEKTILRSPIAGTITKQDTKVGEIISANAQIISIISEAKFEIEADIPEADIAKIKVSNKAKVTLDAYGSDVFFDAKVTAIDPAETIISGVATYKTTFQFIKNDDRIKSGMTANIDIMANSRENVLAVPQRSIISKGEDKIVLVYKDKKTPEERKVKIGLRGSNGFIEIISGLSEGEKIIANGEI